MSREVGCIALDPNIESVNFFYSCWNLLLASLFRVEYEYIIQPLETTPKNQNVALL